jgi:hypothetical protein
MLAATPIVILGTEAHRVLGFLDRPAVTAFVIPTSVGYSLLIPRAESFAGFTGRFAPVYVFGRPARRKKMS